jgi:hypothetical protein
MKLNLSILIGTLGIAATIGAFGVMQPAAASSWKEYRNEKFEYSFQYPASCSFEPLPGECKQNPPEELTQECLCFLNAEDPNNVFLQTFQGEKGGNLTLTSFTVAHYETSAFCPPDDADLAPWLKANFSEIYTNIPEKPNAELGGIPAIAIKMPPTPSTYSHQDIFFMKENKLFLIRMLNPTNKDNQALYNQILSTFSWIE